MTKLYSIHQNTQSFWGGSSLKQKAPNIHTSAVYLQPSTAKGTDSGATLKGHVLLYLDIFKTIYFLCLGPATKTKMFFPSSLKKAAVGKLLCFGHDEGRGEMSDLKNRCIDADLAFINTGT